jgi:acyl-CoA thioester hydrolase
MRCRVPLRVRFGETDAVGVANNAAYLSWFEVGRIEYLRAAGHDYAAVHAGGIDLVVAEATVRYLRPLWFDDEIDLHCWCAQLRRASVEFSYELWSRGELCATGSTRHACVDRARMAPVPLPGWLAAAVAPPPGSGQPGLQPDAASADNRR